MQTTSNFRTARLLHAYRWTGDPGARQQIIVDYMPLVRRLCRRFLGSAEAQDDLFQIGMIGLLKAVDKFDPGRGTRFSSLAIPEVLGAILNHLRDHSGLIKTPRAVRKNKRTIDQDSETLACKLGRWPTMVEVAEASELSEREVHEAAQYGSIGAPCSLDERSIVGQSDDSASLSECVGYDDEELERSVDRLALESAVDTLPPRDRKIVELRFYSDLSQRQTAERIGISQMHVSRLERRALVKLKLALQRSYGPLEDADEQPVASFPSRAQPAVRGPNVAA